jgi:hypothetical protein
MVSGSGWDIDQCTAAWNRRHVPEGFVLVPVEPTREMIHDGACALEVGVRMEGPMNSSKWKADRAFPRHDRRRSPRRPGGPR